MYTQLSASCFCNISSGLGRRSAFLLKGSSCIGLGQLEQFEFNRLLRLLPTSLYTSSANLFSICPTSSRRNEEYVAGLSGASSKSSVQRMQNTTQNFNRKGLQESGSLQMGACGFSGSDTVGTGAFVLDQSWSMQR